jgi:hypothetical protein
MRRRRFRLGEWRKRLRNKRLQRSLVIAEIRRRQAEAANDSGN